MRIDAWSAAPLHRNAPACASAMAIPPRSGVVWPWIFFPPGRSTTPSAAGQTAAERREREGDPERGQEWDEDEAQGRSRFVRVPSVSVVVPAPGEGLLEAGIQTHLGLEPQKPFGLIDRRDTPPRVLEAGPVVGLVGDELDGGFRAGQTLHGLRQLQDGRLGGDSRC